MKIAKKVLLGIILSVLISSSFVFAQTKDKPLVVRVFHSPTCKACIKTIHDVIPPLAAKYSSRVQWVYIDISNRLNYERFLAIEKSAGRKVGSPTIIIGEKVLVGVTEAADSLDQSIKEALGSSQEVRFPEDKGVNIIEHFRSFGPWAVIGAGLIDGINPCAFTVIVFFISFLTVMGYKKRETALIGISYIIAIFATYLVLGLGFFRALYGLKAFYLISKGIYLAIGGLSFFLGGLALRDYFLYKKTGQTEGLALQLPRLIKNKIHAIVGDYYRRDKSEQTRTLASLVASALIVGFMVSLLEAVCTGQIYLPTIVFVLKEETLRGRAIFFLLLYNVMFVLPLIVIFIFALTGATSKQFEAFARKHLALIKIAMAAVFMALGTVLWVGI